VQLVTLSALPRHLPGSPSGRLLFALDGSAVVDTADGCWKIAAGQALWIAERTAASVSTVSGGATIAAIAIDAAAGRRSGPVALTTLMRALLDRLVADAKVRRGACAPPAMLAVLADELGRVPDAAAIVAASDERLKRLAQRLLEPDGSKLTLAEAGREIGMSSRSLSRLVRRETGASFGRWRQMLHVSAAVPRLVAGEPVASVAFAAGYESPSAFIAMFRRVMAATPAAYAARMRRADLPPSLTPDVPQYAERRSTADVASHTGGRKQGKP
jgi:AraC-like DNA-binding protein